LDPAIQVILQQLNELSAHQDKLVACQEELKKNISTSQQELKKGQAPSKTNL
jgi:hypothetical protein